MATTTPTDERVVAFPGHRRLVASGVFGMALFVFTEVMLFAGFISGFVIVKNSVLPSLWPPPHQPRLPVASTAFNTAMLLLSGVALFIAYRAFARGSARAASRWMGAAILLGAFFVVFQGAEWAALLRQGLTLTSSQLGSFFYLIVGAHALHASAALVALAVLWRAMASGRLKVATLASVSLFWYFVVLMWPVIYWKVYL